MFWLNVQSATTQVAILYFLVLVGFVLDKAKLFSSSTAGHLIDMLLPLLRGELREARPFIGPAPGDPPWAKTYGAAFLRFGRTDVLIRASSHMPGALMARRLRIDGTLGTIDLCPIERYDGEALKLTLTSKGEKSQEISFGAQRDRYAPQLVELAAIVRGEKPLDMAGFNRDLKVHETTLRMCEL